MSRLTTSKNYCDDWIKYSEQEMFFSREQSEQKIKEMEREDK